MSRRRKIRNRDKGAMVKVNKLSLDEVTKKLKTLKAKGQDNSKYASHLRCRIT